MESDKIRQRAVLVAFLACIALIVGIVFLGYHWSNLNKEGITCLNNPLGFSEYVVNKNKQEHYVCSCQPEAKKKLDVNLSIFDIGE